MKQIKYLTTEKAADLLDISLPEMQRKLRLGIIPAKRHGRAYMIDPCDVEKYKKNPRPPGNPRISEMKIWELSPHTGNSTLFKSSPNWQKSQRSKRNAKPRRKES